MACDIDDPAAKDRPQPQREMLISGLAPGFLIDAAMQ
jgi:hypothetical protein